MADVLTIDEVAERYRVSRWTCYKLVQRGELPFFRVGSQLRFHADKVDSFFREHRGIPTLDISTGR